MSFSDGLREHFGVLLVVGFGSRIETCEEVSASICISRVLPWVNVKRALLLVYEFTVMGQPLYDIFKD